MLTHCLAPSEHLLYIETWHEIKREGVIVSATVDGAVFVNKTYSIKRINVLLIIGRFVCILPSEMSSECHKMKAQLT